MGKKFALSGGKYLIEGKKWERSLEKYTYIYNILYLLSLFPLVFHISIFRPFLGPLSKDRAQKRKKGTPPPPALDFVSRKK